MNRYVKSFLHRGLVFAGFGPIVIGIVYAILEGGITDFSLSGVQVFVAILSSYVLAFVQAGVSVFNQIEHWPIAKSLSLHFAVLYVTYVCVYLLNSWIPFEPMVVLIFTLIFVMCYFVIWLTVYLITKKTAKNFNAKINR